MTSPMRLLLIGDQQAHRSATSLSSLKPNGAKTKVLCKKNLRITQGMAFLKKIQKNIEAFQPTDVVLHLGQEDLHPTKLEERPIWNNEFVSCLRQMVDWLETSFSDCVVWYSEVLPLFTPEDPDLHWKVIIKGMQVDTPIKNWKCYNKNGSQFYKILNDKICRVIQHPVFWSVVPPVSEPIYYDLSNPSYGKFLDNDGQRLFAKDLLNTVITDGLTSGS